MRLLIDMNLTPRWVLFFTAAGIECAHWSGVGPSESPDQVICEFARERGYVLLTNDLDFPQILAHTRDAKPSVILLRGEPLTPELRGRALLSAIAESGAELEAGALLTVDWSDRVRARLLPLK
jgi:predicted nuclease of predicted toxin-antitoxin system